VRSAGHNGMHLKGARCVFDICFKYSTHPVIKEPSASH
jgi:hypothetical protein